MIELINACRILILLLIAFLCITLLIKLWKETNTFTIKRKATRRVLTTEESRELLWYTYIKHFHGGKL